MDVGLKLGPSLMIFLILLLGFLSTTDCVNDEEIPEPAERLFWIGAFNIQIFGKGKMEKLDVVDELILILDRYDIVLIQEIRDKSGEALQELVRLLNEEASHPNAVTTHFQYVVSEPLGKSTSKEQYAFVYRPDRVEVTATYQYPDPHDVFQREPYAVRFRSSHTEIQDFGIISIHTSPKDAVYELGNLTKVYNEVSQKWGMKDIIIAGDFNADCHYVSRKEERNEISLFTDSRFHTLIGYKEDTTVGDTDCSYDRFVVAEEPLLNAIEPKSVKVYRFDENEFGEVLDQKFALKVSDHYPIELAIVGREYDAVTKGKVVINEVRFKDEDSKVEEKSIDRLYTDRKYLENYGFSLRRYKEGYRYEIYIVTKTKTTRGEVETDLLHFREAHTDPSKQSYFKNLISMEQISMVRQFIESSFLDVPPHVNSLKTNPDPTFKIEILCLKSQLKCDISITRHIFKRG